MSDSLLASCTAISHLELQPGSIRARIKAAKEQIQALANLWRLALAVLNTEKAQLTGSFASGQSGLETGGGKFDGAVYESARGWPVQEVKRVMPDKTRKHFFIVCISVVRKVSGGLDPE